MSAKIVNQYGSIEIDKQVISQVAYRNLKGRKCF